MKKQPVSLFLLLLFFSCTQQEPVPDENALNFAEAKGHIVPADSVIAPEIILAGRPTVVMAGKPNTVVVTTNQNKVKTTAIPLAEPPQVNTPGENTFKLPEKTLAIDSVFVGGIPEVVTAKSAFKKDQATENFSNFGVQQGLISSSVYGMTQDKAGNLWFATMVGVSKYDGKSYSQYNTKQGLYNETVNSILKDRKDNIWLGTDSGLFKYDGKFFTSFPNFFRTKDDWVLSMLEDDQGNIWIGTRFNGVIKYDGKYFTHYTYENGLVWKAISSILQDKKGDIWVATNSGISKFDGKTFTNYTERQGLKNNNVLSMFTDKKGNLWLGTDMGLQKFDGRYFTSIEEETEYTDKTINDTYSTYSVRTIFEDKNENLWFSFHGRGICKYDGSSITHYTLKHGLCANLISWIFQDNTGNLWFGSPIEGVSKYEINSFAFPLESEVLDNNSVDVIIQDKKGNYWIGTGYHSEGVYKYDGTSCAKFTEKDGLANNSIHSIMEDEAGNIWFATLHGLSIYNGKTFTNFSEDQGLNSNYIMSIIEDKNKNVWLVTASKGIIKYDGKYFTNYTQKQGLRSDNVREMIEDRTGCLWIATNGEGVFKYNGKYFTNYTEKDGLSSNFIWSIFEDKSGNIWCGTYGGGVNKYNGKHFIPYKEKDGLNNNIVVSMLQDKKGNLWLGTEHGLSKLSAENLAKSELHRHSGLFENYTIEDGFSEKVCTPNAICEDKNGTIWVGTNNRLTTNSLNINNVDSSAPVIQITGIQLFNEDIPWATLENKDTSLILSKGSKISNVEFDGISNWYFLPENLSLAYDNNYITFSFIGITQKNLNKVKYQFKLEGIEKWNSITNRSEASYINLPHGTYTFKVKAINSDGRWSNEYDYTFTIRPPWWKTWWAYSIYFLSVIGSIWYYIKWREKSLKQRQKELEQTVAERTSEVVAEKKEVEKQKGRIEELIHNILPEEVAEELKQKGSVKAKQFNKVTIMFTDFKGFTRIAENLSAVELVAEIDNCFTAFDNIISKYNIEKIKTIGDSYMCVGGLPVTNTSHAYDLVNAALEIRQFMQTYLQHRKIEKKEGFEIRIGIHTGAVVAGIVGVKKFAYDIWGDTVNIASRMESSGEVGKVNISGNTYELVKDKFNCTYRGKIQAKNKGDIDMYFVERIL